MELIEYHEAQFELDPIWNIQPVQVGVYDFRTSLIIFVRTGRTHAAAYET